MIVPCGLVIGTQFRRIARNESQARIVRRVPWHVAEGGEGDAGEPTLNLDLEAIDQLRAEPMPGVTGVGCDLFDVGTTVFARPDEERCDPVVRIARHEKLLLRGVCRKIFSSRRLMIGYFGHTNRSEPRTGSTLDTL